MTHEQMCTIVRVMTTTNTETSLDEQRAVIVADLKAATEERKHLNWLRSFSPTRGDDEPERQEQGRKLDARIRSLERALGDVDRRIDRENAEAAQAEAAALAEAVQTKRAALPQWERVMYDRLDALEARVNAIVRALRDAGYRVE